jgi:hypothetical protein
MAKSMRIYVAAPYTAADLKGQEINTARAIDAGIAIFKKGHFPYIPHLTHFVDLRAKHIGIKLRWSDYIRWDMPWLELCDALLYLGKSKGADLELARAKQMNKHLFFSIAEIPRVELPPGTKKKTSSGRK